MSREVEKGRWQYCQRFDELANAPLFDQQTIIAYKPRVRGLSQRIAYAPTLETVYLVDHS